MTTIKTLLAAESHPGQHDMFGAYHWTFSPECLDSMVEQAKGLPVTVNFTGPPIGRVVDAERTADGLSLTMDVSADSVPPVASPGFIAHQDDWNGDFTERVIRGADLKGIGLTDD